jgi:hypothetical protein
VDRKTLKTLAGKPGGSNTRCFCSRKQDAISVICRAADRFIGPAGTFSGAPDQRRLIHAFVSYSIKGA